MISDYGVLEVGEMVAVYSNHSHFQGHYKVLKVNKVSVTVVREDGHKRTFSVKTKTEKDKWSSKYNTAWITTIQDSDQREKARELRIQREKLWSQLQSAATHRNLPKLQEIMLQLQ